MIFIVMDLYRVETMHAATTLLRSCHVSATNRTLARVMLAELVLFVAFFKQLSSWPNEGIKRHHFIIVVFVTPLFMT